MIIWSLWSLNYNLGTSLGRMFSKYKGYGLVFSQQRDAKAFKKKMLNRNLSNENKYHTVEKIPKSNRKIVDTGKNRYHT